MSQIENLYAWPSTVEVFGGLKRTPDSADERATALLADIKHSITRYIARTGRAPIGIAMSEVARQILAPRGKFVLLHPTSLFGLPITEPLRREGYEPPLFALVVGIVGRRVS